MKRYVSLVLVLLLICMSFTGCGKKKKQQPQTTEKPSVKISFPEGYTVIQIADLLEEKGVCNAKEFIDLSKTVRENFSYSKLIENPKNRVFTLEGYIYPDTYDFYLNEGAVNAMNRFLSNFSRNITQEDKNRAESLGMTIDDVITLASVIQSEAGVASEMKKVSSVFHNRLNRSYNRLESDVTILYITKKLDKVITDKKEKDKYLKLYNTYDISGLPEGPICNPGRAAITAALYPDQTDYLFFVTDKNTNEYYYAKTFSQHKINCNKAGW